jgi:O-antigen/teichoic acid export membrane protein
LRGAQYIFISEIFSRFISLVLSVIIIRLISKGEFGLISYAQSIVLPLTPFIGLGASHALLRFGAIEKTTDGKWGIYKYAEKYGFYGSLILVIVLISFSKLFFIKIPNSIPYILILSVQLLSNHFKLLLQSMVRVLKKNRLYAIITIVQSIILITVSVPIAYLYKGFGYIIVMSITPLITFVYIKNRYKELNYVSSNPVSSYNNKFWKYGISVGIGAIGSTLLFNIGILAIANIIIDKEKIALYKVATIIPFNLLFLPSSFMKSEFVYLAENATNKKILLKFMTEYWKLFFVISLVIFFVFFIFSKQIITMIFGMQYIEAYKIMKILILGIIGALMLRSLFGGILLSVGKAQWNVAVAFINLTINVFLSIFLISKYGILGASYAITFSLWFGGCLSGVLVLIYIKRYTK